MQEASPHVEKGVRLKFSSTREEDNKSALLSLMHSWKNRLSPKGVVLCYAGSCYLHCAVKHPALPVKVT